MEYIKDLRVSGGVVNSAILVGIANAVMSSSSPEKLAENGIMVEFSSKWTKKWLTRMDTGP